MEPHRNEVLVRRFYAALAEGDLEAIDAIVEDDVVFHEPGESRVGGDYRGKEEVLAFFARIGVVTEGTLRVDQVRDVVTNDRCAIALFDVSAQRGGQMIKGDVSELFTIVDGKITDIRAYVYDQPEWDKAFA